jgi:hypothetical protein
MPWAAAAAVVGAVITADSQRSASNKQKDAADNATELQWDMYNQTREDNLPALDARNSGLTQLQQLLGIGGDAKASNYGMLNRQFTGANLANDPGYRFGLNQGTQAVERSASARGGLFSGATLKALERYGQDYAGTKFNEAFNRNQATNDSRFNRLASLAGLGQTGTSQIGMAGQNAANMAGNYGIQGANAQAAAQMGQANNLSNGMNQLGAWASRNWGSNRGVGATNDQPWYSGQSSTDWWLTNGSSGD